MLDFTALKNDASKCPVSPANETANIKVPDGLKSEPTAAAGALYKEKRKNGNERNLLDVGKLLNERLGRAETAIHDYNKAVRDGKPPEEVALYAARALSLAVSDEMIFTTIAKKYQAEYGIHISPEEGHVIIKEKCVKF